MAFKSDSHTGKLMVEFENIDNYTYKFNFRLDFVFIDF